MISAQVGDLSSHTTKYTSHALTPKVFANIKRVGNGFFGENTPLFDGMLVPQQAADNVDDVVADNILAEDVADGVVDVFIADDVADVVAHTPAEPTPPSPTPTTTPPPPQQEDKIAQALEITKLKQRVKRLEKRNKGGIIAEIDVDKDVTLEEVDAAMDAEVKKNADDDEPKPLELKELIKVVTTAKLMIEVVTVAATTITAAPITAATITVAPSAARRRKEIVIRDPKETSTPSTIVHFKPKSKDKGKSILVKEPKPLKKQAKIEQDEAY
nr:hypothetical protein [Tanacetum cinerariifolium]